MRFLITGGAGFMGSNFVRFILRNYSDVDVIVYDKLTYAGRKENLHDVWNDRRFSFIKADICDEKTLTQVVKEYEPSVVVNFAAESVTADTIVYVHENGVISVKTIAEFFDELKARYGVLSDGFYEVVEVPSYANIRVLGYYAGMGHWIKVKKITRHPYKGTVVRIRQRWGEVTLTPNHSIYDASLKLTTPTEVAEVLAVRKLNYLPRPINELSINIHNSTLEGEYIRVKRSKCSLKRSFNVKRERDEIKALLKLIAAYIAEGWISYNGLEYSVCITNSDIGWLKDIAKGLELISDSSYDFTLRKDCVWQLHIPSKTLYEFLKHYCGVRARNKRMPNFIYRLPYKLQEFFIEQLVKGDGYIYNYRNVEMFKYTTTSRILAAQLGLLLLIMGKNLTYYIRNKETSCEYDIKITNKYWPLHAKRIEKETLSYEGYVYDIELEHVHNFACGLGFIVVHNTHVDRSINEPSPFLRTNVLGTFVILEVVRKYEVPLFIHLSTDEVYGDLPENASASEDYPLRPSSPYSASKASADLLIQGYRRTYGVPVIIVRPCNNYGPYQYPEKLIPKTIIRALHNRPIPIYGKGDQVRDWLFVEDFCEALDLIVRKGRKGEIYNIPGFNEKRNIDVVKAILKLMNKPLSLIKHVADRPGHDRRYSMVGDKIVALGWKPKTKWIEGLRKTINWYLNNAWWWKPLLTDKYFMSETPWETTIKG
ncbi:MAG: dTDP-glucose 4,6-dehydratase [Desulfurococcales archaeon ex4484_217_2]|nr:MAG: dTDP-glucose 4,6-dehydratase [Desulfurococcales archaeon ex4484_217_2]